MSKPNWLLQMQALEAAASVGPWKDDRDGGVWIDPRQDYRFITIAISKNSPNNVQNAAFIAASRTFVPKALECIQDFVEKTPCLCGEFDYVVNKDCAKCELLEKWGLE